jgi:hypothetical protein
MVNFDTTHRELRIIFAIAKRAMGLTIARENDPYTASDVAMDVTAVHCNGNPLRLESLRDADDFNFAHDILGIRRHLNRETGKLDNGFTPRFTRRVAA